MEKYKVSAAMVVYTGAQEAICGVRSILSYSESCQVDFHVIDNASPDGAGGILAETFKDEARVTVVRLGKNIGFGSGHNVVQGVIKSDYHAVVNPDITVDTDVLGMLCGYLAEHSDVVMVTPQLRFPDGSVQNVAKRPPTFLALLARQLPFGFLKKYEKHYLMLDEDLSRDQQIGFCTGSFFVIRTEVFQKMGGFDEGYFMYVEDADITRKAMQYGKVMYLPNGYVYHAWHRSTQKSMKHFLMQLRSMGRYFRKWGFHFQ